MIAYYTGREDEIVVMLAQLHLGMCVCVSTEDGRSHHGRLSSSLLFSATADGGLCEREKNRVREIPNSR